MTESETAGLGDPPGRAALPANSAEDLYWQAAESGHPDPSAYARFALGEQLESRGESDAAADLYREAAESGNAEMSAEARLALGELLASRGDAAGARSAWQAVIDSRSTGWWAESAFINLVNQLFRHNETDGLRAAYYDGAAKGNPEALYALGTLRESGGPGVNADPIEAWKWFSLALLATSNDGKKRAFEAALAGVQKRMTEPQLDVARERLKSWLAEHPAPAKAR